MTHSFSIKEAIVFGWHKVKAHSALVFQVVLTMFALQVASQIVQKTLAQTPIGVAASIVLAVVGVVLGAGMTLIFLRLAQGEQARYQDIWPKLALVWRYFCASLLSGVAAFLPIMAGGLIALVFVLSTGAFSFANGVLVPGQGGVASVVLAVVIMAIAIGLALYIGLRFAMVKLCVLDGAGIMDSLNQSAKLTHGVKWHLIVFALALLALNLVGAVLLLVGLLVTVPVSLFAYAHVYLKLKART